MIKTSDFKKMPLKATFTDRDGNILKGVIKERDTRNFFDGEGDRAFFEPNNTDIAPFWIPLSKLDVLENTIRVLAVRQPWASLIVEGLKTIEIRKQNTNVREKVAIYASRYKTTKNILSGTFGTLGRWEHYKTLNPHKREIIDNLSSRNWATFEYGVILGTVEITSSEMIFDYSSMERDYTYKNSFAPVVMLKEGNYEWGLKNPVKFSEPIPYKPQKGCVVWSKTELPEGDI